MAGNSEFVLPSFDMNIGTNADAQTLLGNSFLPPLDNTAGRNTAGNLLGPMGSTTPPTDNFDWGTMQGWGQVLGGVGNIGTAYMAYKNYGLAKDQFAFNKDLANRNLSNQANIVNADLQHRAAARNAFAGNNSHTAAKVNGAPIG